MQLKNQSKNKNTQQPLKDLPPDSPSLSQENKSGLSVDQNQVQSNSNISSNYNLQLQKNTQSLIHEQEPSVPHKEKSQENNEVLSPDNKAKEMPSTNTSSNYKGNPQKEEEEESFSDELNPKTQDNTQTSADKSNSYLRVIEPPLQKYSGLAIKLIAILNNDSCWQRKGIGFFSNKEPEGIVQLKQQVPPQLSEDKCKPFISQLAATVASKSQIKFKSENNLNQTNSDSDTAFNFKEFIVTYSVRDEMTQDFYDLLVDVNNCIMAGQDDKANKKIENFKTVWDSQLNPRKEENDDEAASCLYG